MRGRAGGLMQQLAVVRGGARVGSCMPLPDPCCRGAMYMLIDPASSSFASPLRFAAPCSAAVTGLSRDRPPCCRLLFHKEEQLLW